MVQRRLVWTLTLLALVLTEKQRFAASAQDTISVQANLVVVPAIVRDKHGALVDGLASNDFHITVDGTEQKIRYLDHDTDVPLTVGMLVDISASVSKVLDEEKKASENFLDSNLAPVGNGRLPDKAFIIQFSYVPELLQDVTDSRPALASGLQNIGTQMHRGGTALYDALYLASTEVINGQSNRRALILLTDGGDNGSKESLEDSIEAAQRAHVVVYAIYYKGKELQSSRVDGKTILQRIPVNGKKVLEHITSETGGRTFEITNRQPVAALYGQIAEELRSQYRLGFTPSDAVAAIGYHHIKLEIGGESAKQKFKLQIPDGYYYGERSRPVSTPPRSTRSR
jgi:VWFA-related protein